MQNIEKNINKLKDYINDISDEEIDIIDLIKFIANSFNGGFDIDKKKNRKLNEILRLKDKVLLILVDGMGYYKVKQLDQRSILKNNLVCGIKTVVPTSTSCVLTSIASATYPSEHGIFGWWQYFRKKNLNYCPLLFVERKSGINLKDKAVTVDDVFRFDTFLNKISCKVHVTMHREILSSDFSKKFIGKNASTHGYYSIKEGFSSLSNKIKKTNSQMLSYMYIDGLDEVSHIYGTKSAEVNYIIKVIEKGIEQLKDENPNTSIVVIADHGQIDMESMIYLNQNHDYTKYFYALPSIDTRMISFYVKDEFKEEFENTFINEFKKDVLLIKTEEIEKYNVFGDSQLSKFAKDSLGEYIAIVVNNKFMLCDKVNLEDKMYNKGNHSGITKEEVTIPLIVI